MKPEQGAHSEAARPGSCAAGGHGAGGHTAGDVRRAGMTLVELLTVMAIIAVVATMSVVTFAPFMRGRALDSAAHALKNAVWQARSYAATHNVRAVLALYSNPSRAAVYWVDPQGNVNNPGDWRGPTGRPPSQDPPVAKPTTLPGNVTFRWAAAPVDVLSWDATNSFVVLGAGGVDNKLVFSPSGSLEPSAPLGVQNAQIGLVGPSGPAVEAQALVVLFASGLPYIEDAR
jgi:prepilin-type N-terminal cleavage/methylation domain-containing protein